MGAEGEHWTFVANVSRWCCVLFCAMTLSVWSKHKQQGQCRNGFGTGLWMSSSGPARARTWTRSNISGETPSNLTELERICRKEWEKLPKYRCARFVLSYPRRLEAEIDAKGASTKYWVKDLNIYVSFSFWIHFQKCLNTCFCFVIMLYCVYVDEGKNDLINFRIRL